MSDDIPEIKTMGSVKDGAEGQAVKEEPASERRIRLLKQMGLVCMACMGHFSLGVALPWPSPALSDIAVNNATLVGTEMALNTLQKDMTGSMVSLGMLFGAWTAGWLVSTLGRIRSMRVIAAPFLIGWLMNALAPNPEVMLVSRFIVGIASGAVSVAASSYVMELADVSVRGMMATMPTVAIVLGGLYTVWMGYALQWHYLALVCAIPPAIMLVVTFLLPDSPSYLVIHGRRQRALAILRKLRGPYAIIEEEVQELERRNLTTATGGQVGWKGLLEPEVRKNLAIMVMLFLFQQLCGNYVFMIQTSRVLKAAGAPWDPDAATVVVGAIRVAGTIVAIFLLDRIGRRYCLIISHAINAMALIILGVYVYLAEGSLPDEEETYSRLSWVPLLCVLVIMFIINVGVHPVPFILGTEYFQTNIRAQASSICFSSGTIFAFLALQLYSPMQDAMTQAGLYWFYASISVLGVVFTFIFIKETKGRSVG
ncbi:facilitated trehalose transporter Tret1-like [Palaemon carinicauda]|uniref:facilitated trehalose transporter Tret1-like n=1 Tax=Palaemon carinicauda TaxID=392227 RepID=UPI0035B6577A